MRSKTGMMALGLLTVLALLWSAPAAAQDSENDILSSLLTGLANSLAAEQHDDAIDRAFSDAFHRDPTDRELRRYRTKMQEDYWTEEDVRNDLRGRSDYRTHASSNHSSGDVERIIRRAYDDILHRQSDTNGMRNFRSHMIDDGWTEQDVREALRKSTEFNRRSSESADKIVRRAYRDILNRDPDHSGLVTYRNHILNNGWDEHDVRELRQSDEYRKKHRRKHK